MELTTRPLYETAACTVSRLDIDGADICYILQDGYRAKKIYGVTRIPAGRYRIVLYSAGTKHAAYSKKYGERHHGMLLLVGVPEFVGILIHIGNTPEDTLGCLLPGQTKTACFVGKSAIAYWSFYPIVAAALMRGEDVWINVNYQPR